MIKNDTQRPAFILLQTIPPAPHPFCNLHTSPIVTPIVIPIVTPIVTSIVTPIVTSIVTPIVTRAVTA